MAPKATELPGLVSDPMLPIGTSQHILVQYPVGAVPYPRKTEMPMGGRD